MAVILTSVTINCYHCIYEAVFYNTNSLPEVRSTSHYVWLGISYLDFSCFLEIVVLLKSSASLNCQVTLRPIQAGRGASLMLIHLQLNQRMKMQGTGPWSRLKARVLSLTERNSPKASGRPESAGGCNCKAESWKRSGRGKRRMQPQMMILGPIQVMALKAASVMMRTSEEEWVRPLLVQMSRDYICKAVWFPSILAHWWEMLGHQFLQAQLLCNLSSRYWPHCSDPAQWNSSTL